MSVSDLTAITERTTIAELERILEANDVIATAAIDGAGRFGCVITKRAHVAPSGMATGATLAEAVRAALADFMLNELKIGAPRLV